MKDDTNISSIDFAKLSLPNEKIYPWQQELLDAMEKGRNPLMVPARKLGKTKQGMSALSIKVDRKHHVRPNLILIDDPLLDREKLEANQLVLEYRALADYNFMIDTGALIVSETHDHSGAVSLLNHIEEFKKRAYYNGTELKYIFIPVTSIGEVRQTLYNKLNQRPMPYNKEDMNIGTILYNDMIIDTYSSTMDLSTKAGQIYINNKTVKMGVIKFTLGEE